MADAKKIRNGKVVLVGPFDKMLYYPKTNAERAKALIDFGWSGEDYRQATIAKDGSQAIAKPEDFIPFYFRHLSATIVGGYSWKATYFSDKVLKAAVDKLSLKPAYVNHELEVGNIIGANGQIKYVPASKADDGTEVPGGLEGPIWIDSLLHTDLCRKLTAYPVPHIQSVSVTVSYNWEPSHEFQDREGNDDEWEFEYRIGTIVDGTMVCRNVTEIIDFYETSLVYLGADPFAKILNEKGEPINIEKSAVIGNSKFKADPLIDLYKKTGTYFIEESSLGKEKILHLKKSVAQSFSKTGKSEQSLNQEKNLAMEKIIAALVKKLGKEEKDITPEMIDQYTFVSATDMAAFNKAKTDLDAEKLAKDKAVGELAAANQIVAKYADICAPEKLEKLASTVPLADVKKMAKFGSAVMKSKKEEAIKFYKLSVGAGNEVQAVIDTITNANDEALDGFLKQYGGSAIKHFGASCKDCNSKNITFRSSINGEGEEGKKDEGKQDEGSMSERLRRN